MIIVEPSVTVIGVTTLVGDWRPDGDQDPCSPAARVIERAGRVCWKSEGKIEPGSAAGFCDRVLNMYGHESVAEHASATMVFVTDRIVANQLVRARIAAYSQESTHYLNYANARHDRQIRVCLPHDIKPNSLAYERWRQAMVQAEEAYFDLIEEHGVKHYEARYVLPLGLKTELVATYNFRMWRHVVDQRTAVGPDGKPKNTPETHQLMLRAGRALALLCPEVFSDYVKKDPAVAERPVLVQPARDAA